MSFTETTTESWGSRLMSSIKNVIIGVVLFILAFPVLFLNEGCAVTSYKLNKETAKSVVEIPSSPIDPANDGAFVHVMGQANTGAVVEDAEFGVRQGSAFSMTRTVEMYQWKENVKSETKKNVGGSSTTTKTYTYEKVWSGDLIDSSTFKESGQYRNPGAMPYSDKSIVASEATLGDFTLPKDLIADITGSQPRAVNQATIDALPADVKARAKVVDGAIYTCAPTAQGNITVTTNTSTPDGQAPVTVTTDKPGGQVVTTSTPTGPQVGDVRIRFAYVGSPAEVTVQARQAGKSFAPGALQYRLMMGRKSAEEAKQADDSGTAGRTWIIRVIGFIMMVAGISMVLAPLSVVADVVPIVGNLVQTGAFFAALIIAIPFALTTIAVAWVFFRPLVGIPLLLIAVGSVVYIVMSGKKKGAAEPVAA